MAFIQPSWNATQLAQANGLSPGLADYMLAHNAGFDSNPANQQFYQAAGFTNPAGSQTMLNQAGRDWILNNNQTYGNINADAGQPNGPRMGYGMMGSTPYSYSLGQAATDPALQQWLIKARSGATNIGPPPTGATLYSQFGPQGVGASGASGGYGSAGSTAGAALGSLYNNPGASSMTPVFGGSALPYQVGSSPGTPFVPVGTTLGQIANGGGMAYAGGSPTFNENMGGNMNIAPYAGNPYSLNIWNYLNPMMSYAMQQGDQSILNNQASAGLLNSGDTAKQLYGYGLGMGAQNFNNAAQIAAGQQGFGAGLDQYDQQFAYNAQNNDRNFALQSLLGMGNLGLGGATQQGWNDRYLAQMLSGNLGALGQAQGAGAIGGSNAINNSISQMLQNYLGANALQQYLGGGGTGIG